MRADPASQLVVHHRAPPSTEAVRRIRLAVRRALIDAGLDDDVSGDVELAAAELLTNAYEAAPAVVELRLDLGPDHLLLTVTNDLRGTAAPPDLAAPPATSDDDRGRGLPIVRALADEVRIDASPQRVRISCRWDGRSLDGFSRGGGDHRAR